MLSYNYWMREEKMSGPEQLGYVRGDIAVAYLFTALFGMAIMMTANQAFYVPGVAITNAQAVPKMAEMLGSILGAFGRVSFSIGFWAAVFASLLGVWQSVPYIYADFYGIIKRLSLEERARVTNVASTPYRLALAFVAISPIPFAFTGQPIQVIVAYTIVGSLFVPFLAATLLYLNNRVKWLTAVPHNNRLVNALLIVILLLFAIVGGDEVRRAIGPLLEP
jgi:Mn2+/Fe2+ NRAMP family transporter